MNLPADVKADYLATVVAMVAGANLVVATTAAYKAELVDLLTAMAATEALAVKVVASVDSVVVETEHTTSIQDLQLVRLLTLTTRSVDLAIS